LARNLKPEFSALRVQFVKFGCDYETETETATTVSHSPRANANETLYTYFCIFSVFFCRWQLWSSISWR